MPSESLLKDRKREFYHNRRPPLGYNRQIGSYYEGNGHGCTPPRPSNDRYIGGRGSFRRSPYYNGEPRSVAVQIIPTPSPPPLKDVHNKNSGGDDQRLDLDWDRPLSQPLKVEVLALALGKEMLVSSAPAGLEDEMPRKRSRLSWGQGLAKYEKEKVEGSMNSESSLKVSGSMSPATPCSAAACLSPATEDRPFSKAKDIDKDTSHHSERSAIDPSHCLEELHINLDQLPPISVLTSLLDDLLQPEDACTGDSTFARHTATSKLVLFKADISKELEKTECEIDLLENELKSLNNDRRCNPSQISFLLQDESSSIPCPESVDVSAKVSSDLSSVISSAMATSMQPDLPVYSCSKHEFEVKHANNDTSQIVLSSNGESASSGNLEQLSLDLGERAVAGKDSGHSNHSGGGGGSNANLDVCSHGNEDNNFIDLIIASNRDASRRASQAFDRALPTASQEFDIWGSDRILSCRKNDMHIREKLALRERKIKFKELILALKFRALNHLWKEDLRLLSFRKQRTKSQKRFDLCGHSSQSSLQKHCSSIRSILTLPAGNLTLVPTEDIVEFSSKLLSESQIKLYRNNLKMPALVLDEERGTGFITKNNLIEDPLSIEKERSMVNSWTLEEKEVFMKKLAMLGKDFAKISSFLSHKTTADCIEFYYKNHKSESFRDVKKQLDLRKQWHCLPTNAYMVTSGRKWNRDSNVASLDMLGAVSVAIAHNDNRRNQPKYSARSIVPGYHSAKFSCGSYNTLERANSTGISGGEKEIAVTDVLAGEAVSSSVTSLICPLVKMNVVRISMPSTPEVAQTTEEEATCSDEGCGALESVDWTDEEKSLFIRALGLYGKDFARISHCVGSKSREHCKTFFSKARKCLGLDQIYLAAGNGGTLLSDANGGRSDTDAAEIDSAICSTESCSRMDVDFTNTATGGEVGGCSQKEINGKVDGLESVLKVEKLELEGESLQSKCESVLCHDCVELTVGRELGKVETGVSVSFAQPSKASCTEGGQLKSQVRGGIKSEEVELQQVPLIISKAGSGERRLKKIDTDKGNSVNFSLTADFNAKENESYLAAKLNNACSNNRIFSFSTHQHPIPLELLYCSQKKSQMLSTVLPDPSSTCSESSLNFDEHLHGLHQGSATKDLHLQYLSRINSNRQIDQSSNVLSGYPLQVLNQKEFKIDTNMFINGNLSSQLNGLTVPCKVTEEQSNHRDGDVKLFGQILINSSSLETDCQSLSPKQKKPSMMKTSSTSRKGSIGQSSLEEIPPQSYGYWDGNRIQTGLSSLPPESSAIMFSAYQGPILAGKPFFSTAKDIGVSSTNGATTTNYQQANGKRNGFELVSGIQQGGRTAMARLGVNMAVSDPVASLKMAKLWKQDLNDR